MAASFLNISTASTFTPISRPKIHPSSQSYKPLKVSMSQTQISWGAVNAEVEANIEHILSGREPSSVFEPMKRLVSDVPRSLAPALCIAACEAVGGQKEKAITAASALHLMHVATYTHEYLELSNESENQTSLVIDHAFSPDVELVTADNMVKLGYQIVADMDDSERALCVTIELGRMMGSQGMINGQYLKMKYFNKENEGSCEEGVIEQAFEKKGGALYSCGAACGAIMGGGSEVEIEKLKTYGLYVGMIHNIMIHDVVGREKRLIKLADKLKYLALRELEGMKDKNVEPLASIMDGFGAFLRVQKYQFPRRA